MNDSNEDAGKSVPNIKVKEKKYYNKRLKKQWKNMNFIF